MKVAVFDYGAGNLHSLVKALALSGVEVRVERNPARAAAGADALVLPGVGAFGAAAARLAPGRAVMRRAIDEGLPTLGICLGMQLLFEGSDEGEGEGLGVLPGRARRLTGRHVPQIGWNTLDGRCDPLFDASELDTAFYANGYVCPDGPRDMVTAWSTHESDTFPAAVRLGGVVGVQFHPEKSSVRGVAFVRSFLEAVRR